MLIVGVLGYLFFHYFLDPELYKKILEESLTQAFQKEVHVGKAKISLWDGASFVFEDFHVKDPSLAADLLSSKMLILKVKLLPLLKGEVKWKRIVLDQPALRLHRDRNGQFNLLGDPLSVKGLKTSQQKVIQMLSTLFEGSITLRNGEMTFSDEGMGPTPLITKIKAFHLMLSEVSYQKPFPFRLSGDVVHSGKVGRIIMSGTIRNIPEDMDLSKGKVNAKMEMEGIQTSHFWPYLKSFLPMETLSGDIDGVAQYEGGFQGAFKASAKIKFKDLIFNYPKVFAYVMKPNWMKVDLMVEYDHKDLQIPLLSVELPELWVKAKGKIYAIGSEKMGLDAEAHSGSFDLSEGKKFIPFRIITRDVSEPLFRSEGNGTVQILSVRLSGQMVPEIEHCDQPQHAHTLSIEMKTDGVRLKLPWNLPPLENLKGNLSYKDGHLNFRQTDGKVFQSRIDRAHGIFYQLLQVPTLQASLEGRIDLRDLSSFMKIEGLGGDLSRILSPIHINSGWADYRLFTKVVLKPPLRFQHEGSYHLWKAQFTHQQIPFPIFIREGEMELSNDALQWSRARVDFGNSSLLTNGSWKGKEGVNPFEMAIKGRADLKNLFSLVNSPLFSKEVHSKIEWIEDLSGTAELSFKGKGQPSLQLSSYEGEITPRGVTLRPKGASSLLILKEGIFSFSPSGVHFSKFMIYSNFSSLTLDGEIKEGHINLSTRGLIDWKDLFPVLQSPLSSDQIRSQLKEIQGISGVMEGRLKWFGRGEEVMTLLKEGEIQLKGFSLQHRKLPVPFSTMEGSLFFSPEQVRMVGVKGMLGNSPISFSGTLSRSSSSQIAETGAGEGSRKQVKVFAFRFTSPLLDFDSLLSKGEKRSPLSFEKLRDWLSVWSLDGKVEIAKGKLRGFSFQDLKVEMKTRDGKLIFDPFQFRGLEGDLWGRGWIAPTEKGIRFEISPRLSNMEAKAFLRALLQKDEEERIDITGRVFIDRVELQGEGENFQKVVESLNGRLRLEVGNGTIERWKTLSRIFSLLNVSQLFWGRLPDLKTKGLPYREIMADILFKDGVASTEDFVVESDAIRITLLGKIDFGKNQIDTTIGVHPLVTLDMVLSNLPIAGYIITGKDKAFLSYVYEVKGDLDNPKIEAVPLKGLGENFWGIIRRLLETPIRPFQKAPSNNNSKEKK
jgi:uncharacterized protein YhdP